MIRFFLVLFVTVAAAAFVLAVIPMPPAIPLVQSDYVLHGLVFALLSLLGGLAFPDTPRPRLWMGLVLFGGLIELVQALPALHRDADWLDWVADSLAAALVLSMFPRRSLLIR